MARIETGLNTYILTPRRVVEKSRKGSTVRQILLSDIQKANVYHAWPLGYSVHIWQVSGGVDMMINCKKEVARDFVAQIEYAMLNF